jgi:hypothetical protein
VYVTTLRDVIAVDSPPPAEEGAQATWYGALGSLSRGNFFERQTRHRLAVVVTDGESRQFSGDALRRALYGGVPIHAIVVGVGTRSEAVYNGKRIESQYRPDPGAGASLRRLSAATGSRLYGVGEADAVAARIGRMLDGVPRERAAAGENAVALAPYVLLLAALLVALPLLLRRLDFSPAALRRRVPGRRSRPHPRNTTAREGS